MQIMFVVEGIPQPKGSMKAFPRGKKIVVINDSKKTKPWQYAITEAAKAAVCKAGMSSPHDKGLKVIAEFYMPRAKSRKGCHNHIHKPDLDKLTRALLDGMTGVVYEDDSQVCSLYVGKWYRDISGPTAGKPGVSVVIETYPA